MRIKWFFLILLVVLLCGCEKADGDTSVEADSIVVTTEPIISPTVPENGDPGDVTCKGSYTGQGNAEEVVATCGSTELTSDQLQVWYWAVVSQYKQEKHPMEPDFQRPLDEQICEVDNSVNSWQQYFLRKAISAWHNAQALILHSEEVPLTLEEAYQPDPKRTERYMTGMPAAEVLYGYYSHYRPNSMHQAYLDEIPQILESLAGGKGYADANTMAAKSFGASSTSLESFAYCSNLAYMYFTTLSHYIKPTNEELDDFYAQNASTYASAENSVNFRQILLIPGDEVEANVAADGTVSCAEEVWLNCEAEARQLVKNWQKKNKGTEATFADMAHKNSRDTGTAINGGWYQGVRKGQMIEVIDNWCFDPARQIGDTEILRSDYGVHILFFSGSQSVGREAAEKAYYSQQQKILIAEAKASYPIQVNYSAISLKEAEGMVAMSEILYPDIAHERFPEIPLYLQQDYPNTWYGGFKIRSNGCGITSFSMLASYMTDNEMTPPEMCARYGRYSHYNGTDGLLFNNEPAVLGFYLREKTYDTRMAKKALEEGHVVISVQHPGYWTRGGHYIVCESINEEGKVQVRDSNIYNYFNIRSHKEDAHEWGNITAAGSGYWIYEYKITRIPACSRCGNPSGVTTSLLNVDYICEKCGPAILRRASYLNN